jgi:hypothetical protein
MKYEVRNYEPIFLVGWRIWRIGWINLNLNLQLFASNHKIVRYFEQIHREVLVKKKSIACRVMKEQLCWSCFIQNKSKIEYNSNICTICPDGPWTAKYLFSSKTPLYIKSFYSMTLHSKCILCLFFWIDAIFSFLRNDGIFNHKFDRLKVNWGK